MMFTGLVLIYGGLQLNKDPMAITTISHIISILLPIIAIVFCLNEKEPKWRYGLMAVNFLILFLMGYLFFATM